MTEPVPGLDPECLQLMEAMNLYHGITTVESCCGHGEYPYRMWFTVDSLLDLPHLLYWFDSCHSGQSGWKVIATTDCAASPVIFMVESQDMGEDAYQQAKIIAKLMKENFDDID